MRKIFKIPGVGQVAFGLVIDPHGASKRVHIMQEEAFETNMTAKVIHGADFLIDGHLKAKYFIGDKIVDTKDLYKYTALQQAMKKYVKGSGREVSVFDLGKLTPEQIQTKEMVEGTGVERKVKDYFGSNRFQRFLYSLWYRDRTKLNLGSGLVTNVGVLALANDWNLAAPSGAAINTIKLANWHISGKGTNGAAATDIKLQTISTSGGQTPVAGTQSLISVANLQKYQTVATIAYTNTEAVTEWGLICGSAVSSATGSPFTAGTATTGTVTATPLTASSSTIQGLQQNILENTGNATPHWGLVTSNTTSVATVPAWYKVSDGTAAGVTPANTDTFVSRPVMWDRKQFSAINVVNGDSIQYTYTLTVTSGG